VRLWEIGNEIWGDWVRGHSDAPTYAANYLRYARAMKAKDPKIALIAVGDNDMAWNRTLLRAAASEIDHLAIHHYYGNKEMAGDAANLMARPLRYERFYADVAKLVREEAGGRPIRLSINEWGLSISEKRYYSMEAAAYGARLMNVLERSPNVAMSAESDLVNGWPGGIIQASRHGLFVSPLYYVNQLYNESLGRDRLRTTVEGPTFDTSLEGKGVPALDAVASRSADGSRVFVKLVNTSAAGASARIELRGLSVAPEAERQLLAADSLAVRNSFATPDAIQPRRGGRASRAVVRAAASAAIGVHPRPHDGSRQARTLALSTHRLAPAASGGFMFVGGPGGLRPAVGARAPRPRALHARPDDGRAARRARARALSRRRDGPGARHPAAAVEEQPRARRRGGCRQDRDRRGAGAADRARPGAGRAGALAHPDALAPRPDRRLQLPRAVREAPARRDR
jgi:hypothetical protein